MARISQNRLVREVFSMTNKSKGAAPPSTEDESESASHFEMEKILQEMLEKDEDITARGVIRRHTSLKAASSITRSNERKDLLANYQARQAEFRGWRKRLAKRSKDSTALSMAEKDVLITEFKHQIELLTASHVAMIRAIGELGGYTKWAQFFGSYKGVLEMLTSMGAMPEAEVRTIKKAPRSRRNE